MNTDEFLQMVNQHLPAINRFGTALLRQKEDVEDVVQQTLMKAFAHRDQLRDVDCVKPWLMQIAVNEARMKMRERRRLWRLFPFVSQGNSDPSSDPQEAHTAFWEAIPDPGETPDTTLERRQQAAAIDNAIHKLPPRYREVFVLRDVLGMSSAQAMVALGLSESALHTRLHRARKQMRKMLEPYLGRNAMTWRPFIRDMKEMMTMVRMKVISCRRVQQEMDMYLDRELCDTIAKQIEDHVRLCTRCCLLLDTAKKALHLVADGELLNESFACSRNWKQALEDFPPTNASEYHW